MILKMEYFWLNFREKVGELIWFMIDFVEKCLAAFEKEDKTKEEKYC